MTTQRKLASSLPFTLYKTALEHVGSQRVSELLGQTVVKYTLYQEAEEVFVSP